MQIFIGNVSKNINKNQLRKELEKFGDVESLNINDEIAYVEMPLQKEAENAILHLDKSKLDGIKLSVHEARNGLDDRRLSGRIGGRRSNDPKNYSKMFSRNDFLI